MKIASSTAAICVLALGASPVLAAPAFAAPVAQPAASLSVAKSVRAASVSKRGSKLAAPGATVGLILAGAVIAGGIIIAVDDSDSSDSN